MISLPPVTVTSNLPANVNARHNLFGIKIKPGLKYHDAILAQELFEWRYLRKWGLIMAAPFTIAAIVLGGVPAIFLGLAAIIAFLKGPCLPSLTRRMEIIGHAIEWIVATEKLGAPEDAYLLAEVNALTHYKQFAGWTKEQIMDAMLAAVPVARKHV